MAAAATPYLRQIPNKFLGILRKETVIFMKKIISLLLAIVLVVGCSALVVSAAPSPEVDDIVKIIEAKDKDGKTVEIILTKSEKTDDALKPTDNDEASMGQYDVEIKGTPEYPVTVKAKVDGVKTTSEVYILTKKADGTIDKIIATVIGEGQIEFKLDSACTILSVIADKKTATDVGTSDKTGDMTTPVVMVVLLASVVGMAVSVKKIKA